jgi:hypothetical protein
MIKQFFRIIALAAACASLQAQPPQPSAPVSNQANAPTSQTTPAAQTASVANRSGFDLAECGVEIAPEPRLIIVMAALEAAGWEAAPNRPPSAFRAEVRKDLEGLDKNLRDSLQKFYALHRLPNDATPAEQAARYVSLAYAVGNLPNFETFNADELPSEVLEVLDFVPLLREFYRRSGIAGRMPAYLQAYRSEAENLRRQLPPMLRETLSYLHTRPVTVYTERVQVDAPTSDPKKRKNAPKVTTAVERERRFVVVPELLAAPGAINLRVIGENYYAIVPFGVNPSSSELRRAYLQFLVDPLVSRFNREIALKRPTIRQLLDARKAANPNFEPPDIFTATARSLVVAADVRMNELARLREAAAGGAARMQAAPADKNQANAQANRNRFGRESQAETQRIEDESIAQLADAYERGAVLDFYFAEQLRGVESSGFDIAASFADMINSIDAAREARRLDEVKPQRERAMLARLEAKRRAAASNDEPEIDARRARLIQNLKDVDEMLRLKRYEEAENRLKQLQQEFQGEPRVFFALAQTSSLSAAGAFDQDLINERLTRALANYRLAIAAATPDTDAALLSRAHTAAGKILRYFERDDEAAKEFDAAIALGEVQGGAYSEALKERKELAQKKQEE